MDSPDGGFELIRVDRLDEMVVESGLERAFAVVCLTVARDRDQREIGFALPAPQFACELIAVYRRQSDVEYPDMRRELGAGGNDFGRFGNDPGLVA